MGGRTTCATAFSAGAPSDELVGSLEHPEQGATSRISGRGSMGTKDESSLTGSRRPLSLSEHWQVLSCEGFSQGAIPSIHELTMTCSTFPTRTLIWYSKSWTRPCMSNISAVCCSIQASLVLKRSSNSRIIDLCSLITSSNSSDTFFSKPS